MQLYHAHIYFQSSDTDKIKALETLARVLGLFHELEIYPTPIGPHPLPTLELHFYENNYLAVKAWLELNQGEYSILIHEETGNDVRDHSENIEWLGEPVPIDFGFFDLILKHPGLRVHPVKS